MGTQLIYIMVVGDHWDFFHLHRQCQQHILRCNDAILFQNLVRYLKSDQKSDLMTTISSDNTRSDNQKTDGWQDHYLFFYLVTSAQIFSRVIKKRAKTDRAFRVFSNLSVQINSDDLPDKT